MFDWIKEDKENEKKRLLKAEEWKKENLTPEVRKVLSECQYGFDLYCKPYGSDAVVVNYILKLEKRIEKLENAKNDK